MGAHPYWYFVDYDPDIMSALDALREREFQAGRYSPVILFPKYPVGPNSPAPGARHATIEEALEDAAEDGTRSILDIDHVSDVPDFCAASPVDNELLMELYGTDKPSREMVEQNLDFLEEIDRGHAIYIVLYEGQMPSEICFAGYSFD
jgi:hypothetical protein